MMNILVGARDSPLSRAQFREVQSSISVQIEPVWVETSGDLDRKKSLRDLDKSNFFTKELDEMLLRGEIRAAIHSAKDLPDPIACGLSVIALTQSIDSRDVLVFREGETLETLPRNARIGTSSMRREDVVKALRSDLSFVDVRGNIGERLSLLDQRFVDGVVVAEAALIRLQLQSLNRIFLPGNTAAHQGRLAIVARTGDHEMQTLFDVLCEKNSD